jgi:hypothetical protein
VNDNGAYEERRKVAEAVRAACLQAALSGYEDASMNGLCHEGAWEVAVDAIRSLNVEAIVRRLEKDRS